MRRVGPFATATAGCRLLAGPLGGCRRVPAEVQADGCRTRTPSPDAVQITLFGGTGDADLLKRCRDMGVARVVVTLQPEAAEKTLPLLER